MREHQMSIDFGLSKQISGPVWPDECSHGPDEYVGSFSLGAERCDVYVFEGGMDLQEVCVRYGAEGLEYFSPGCLLDMLIVGLSHRDTKYRDMRYLAAYRLICDQGNIRWTRTKTEVKKDSGVRRWYRTTLGGVRSYPDAVFYSRTNPYGQSALTPESNKAANTPISQEEAISDIQRRLKEIGDPTGQEAPSIAGRARMREIVGRTAF